MTLEEVVEFIKRMDINYNKDYHKNVDYINEWYKDLQFYDKEDVNNSFDKYLKSTYSDIYPKKWALLNPIKTIKHKKELETKYTICPICLRNVNLVEYDHHYGRCMDIQFIEKYVKKYTGKEIDYDKYWNFSDEELKQRYDKLAKLIIEKEPDGTMAECLRNYLKNN